MDVLRQLRFYIPQLTTRQNIFRCPVVRSNIVIKSRIYTMCYNYNQIHGQCDITVCSLSTFMSITTAFFDVQEYDVLYDIPL